MEKINLEEIKRIELDILLDFKTFCDKYELRYYLAYGTLIGAIRHEGFIPWDDDIDVQMPREDYDKFILLIQEGKMLNNENFEVQIPLYTKNYIYPYIKICDKNTLCISNKLNKKYWSGVWIDVFPIDFYPESSKECEKFQKEINRKQKIYTRSIYTYSSNKIKTFIKDLLFNMLSFFGKDSIYWRDSILKSQYKTHTSKIGTYIIGSSENSINSAELLENPIEVKFENNIFTTFRKYDIYLKSIYGDYMKLPPEEDRITHEMLAYKRNEEKENDL